MVETPKHERKREPDKPSGKVRIAFSAPPERAEAERHLELAAQVEAAAAKLLARVKEGRAIARLHRELARELTKISKRRSECLKKSAVS